MIFISFGSMAQSAAMPKQMKKAFLDTFKRFPDVTFIWKYERDEDNIAANLDNLITEEWLPQNDILGGLTF